MYQTAGGWNSTQSIKRKQKSPPLLLLCLLRKQFSKVFLFAAVVLTSYDTVTLPFLTPNSYPFSGISIAQLPLKGRACKNKLNKQAQIFQNKYFDLKYLEQRNIDKTRIVILPLLKNSSKFLVIMYLKVLNNVVWCFYTAFNFKSRRDHNNHTVWSESSRKKNHIFFSHKMNLIILQKHVYLKGDKLWKSLFFLVSCQYVSWIFQASTLQSMLI